MKNKLNFEEVEDSFQAFLVKGAHFTKTEEYPIIPREFISNRLPVKIMHFSKAITYRGDLHDTFICFFSPDKSFERVRKNPKRYLSFFKRTAGIIGFDYSIHSDMPVIKQKAQMNDNLSLTYYYGSNGISVIPNLRCGIDDLLPEFLSALPKRSVVAVGTHGFIKTKHERYNWFCFLETIINEIEPKDVVVYGTLNDPMFDELKSRTNIVCYDAWNDPRRKEASHV